jgi:AcrR family transcriptional regulator
MKVSRSDSHKRGRPRDEALASRRRGEILDAATRLFATLGYRRMDVQQLADQLGVGKGTVYRYFPTKEELFLAAVDRGVQGLIDHLHRRTETRGDPLERIQAGIEAYLEYFHAHPELPELFILERAEFKNRQKSLYFDRKEEDDRWRAVIRDLQADGRLRDIGADAILDVMGDLLYGTMFTKFLSGRDKPLALQVRDIVDVVFHGLLGEEERHKLENHEDP